MRGAAAGRIGGQSRKLQVADLAVRRVGIRIQGRNRACQQLIQGFRRCIAPLCCQTLYNRLYIFCHLFIAGIVRCERPCQQGLDRDTLCKLLIGKLLRHYLRLIRRHTVLHQYAGQQCFYQTLHARLQEVSGVLLEVIHAFNRFHMLGSVADAVVRQSDIADGAGAGDQRAGLHVIEHVSLVCFDAGRILRVEMSGEHQIHPRVRQRVGYGFVILDQIFGEHGGLHAGVGNQTVVHHADGTATRLYGSLDLCQYPVERIIVELAAGFLVGIRLVIVINAGVHDDQAVILAEIHRIGEGVGVLRHSLSVAKVLVDILEFLGIDRIDLFRSIAVEPDGMGIGNIVVAIDDEHFNTGRLFQGGKLLCQQLVIDLFTIFGQVAGDEQILRTTSGHFLQRCVQNGFALLEQLAVRGQILIKCRAGAAQLLRIVQMDVGEDGDRRLGQTRETLLKIPIDLASVAFALQEVHIEEGLLILVQGRGVGRVRGIVDFVGGLVKLQIAEPAVAAVIGKLIVGQDGDDVLVIVVFQDLNAGAVAVAAHHHKDLVITLYQLPQLLTLLAELDGAGLGVGTILHIVGGDDGGNILVLLQHGLEPVQLLVVGVPCGFTIALRGQGQNHVNPVAAPDEHTSAPRLRGQIPVRQVLDKLAVASEGL